MQCFLPPCPSNRRIARNLPAIRGKIIPLILVSPLLPRPKPRIVKSIIIPILALIAVPNLFAQSCDDIIAQGLRDHSHFESYDALKVQFSETLKKTYQQIKEQAEKGSGSGKIVAFGILEMGGGGGSEQQRLENIRSTYERDTSLFYNSEIFKRLVMATTNESVVNAWRDCMASKTLMSFYTGDASSEFLVYLRYVPRDSSHPDSAPISDVGHTTNLALRHEGTDASSAPKIREGAALKKFAMLSQVITRKDQRAASLSVDIGGIGSTVIKFPEVPDPPLPPAEKIVQTDWQLHRIPMSPGYGKERKHTIKLTVPEGGRIIPESVEWWVGGGRFGKWAEGVNFSDEGRTVTRSYTHWKHDQGDGLAVRCKYVIKVTAPSRSGK